MNMSQQGVVSRANHMKQVMGKDRSWGLWMNTNGLMVNPAQGPYGLKQPLSISGPCISSLL